MNVIEFGQLIYSELRVLGYEIHEEPDMIIDLIEELYDCIVGVYPEAVLTMTKEFDRDVTFYFKRSPKDDEYEATRMTVGIGIPKSTWLRKIQRPNEPENIGAVTGKIRWLTT